MRYCVEWSGGVWQHFRGFEATVVSATTTFVQTYGTLKDASTTSTKCESFDFGDEEITHITTYSDHNDVEGI